MKKKIIPFDDYNHRIHPGVDFVGTILPTWGNFAFTNGWKLIETDKDMAKHYRIRKLTSRECFRLMGVTDADIDKIQMYPFHELVKYPSYSKEEILAGMTDAEKRMLMKDKISESQQYKMAGNSIVVPVLEGIFTQMFRSDEDALF